MDVSLPITGGGLLLVATGFALKKVISFGFDWKSKVDQHLVDCNEKAISHARLEERMDSSDANQTRLEGKVDKMDSKIDRLLERD